MFGVGRFVKKNLSGIFGRDTSTSTPKLKDMESKMDNLGVKLADLEAKLDAYHRANFFNQIALANQKEGPVVLYMPWNPTDRKTLCLERVAPGRLSFNPVGDQGKKPIHIITLPKSGTHLLMLVLTNLGFSPSDIGSEPTGAPSYACGEMNTLVSDQRKAVYPDLGDEKRFVYVFPYPLMAGLSSNGVYYASHVNEAASLRWAHHHEKILLSVRDLRDVTVSFLRWFIRLGQIPMPGKPGDYFPTTNDLTSDLLLNYLNGIPLNLPFSFAEAYIKILNDPFVRLVKFEEMTSPDLEIMRKPAEAIAEVTECPLEEVLKVMASANGRETRTFSGRHSKLGDFWTQEVENKFIELGGDILNEQLGYSRHYTPKG